MADHEAMACIAPFITFTTAPTCEPDEGHYLQSAGRIGSRYQNDRTMRHDLRSAPRSADQAGGGIWAGGTLIVALLFANPEAALAQALSLQATLSEHNGYNIACFGGRDGAIDITVSGGTAPYTYEWSTSETAEDLQDLPAGYYSVRVVDANNDEVRREWNLTEPPALKGQANVFLYPNGYNVSCYQCYNGSITVLPVDGVAPYTYLWHDGVTTQGRSGLGTVQTHVTITDANACTWRSEVFTLTSPERTDWTMSGNTGTNPASQFIGTTDNKDFVFRTNGVERFKLGANGHAAFQSLNFSGGYRLLMADSMGVLRSLDQNSAIAKECFAPWVLCGNNVNVNAKLGTRNSEPLRIITDDQERMYFDTDGKVRIGTIPPTGMVGQYRLYVENGIATRDVQVKLNSWPDVVFGDSYRLMSLEDLRCFLKRNNHLPGIPSAKELEAQGGVEIGDMQRRLVQVVEEQALYILQLEERMRAMEQRLHTLETSK